MTLGFVGTGAITAALVEGLAATGDDRPITLSPRNAEVAARLAGRFAHVSVAPDNQAVLDRSDLVVLAIRPQIAGEVLGRLAFRAGQRVVSLIATMPLDRLRSLTAPAGDVTRVVPLPSAARRQGPIVIYPPDPAIVALFDRVGTTIPLNDESEFEVFTAGTALMSSQFAIAGAAVQWMARRGIAEGTARDFFAAMLEGLAGTAVAQPERGFSQLAEEHQTPGGLNEQVLHLLERHGVLGTLQQALDAVEERLRRPYRG
jgi:pyrroline-5-carboxylate reductase